MANIFPSAFAIAVICLSSLLILLPKKIQLPWTNKDTRDYVLRQDLPSLGAFQLAQLADFENIEVMRVAKEGENMNRVDIKLKGQRSEVMCK